MSQLAQSRDSKYRDREGHPILWRRWAPQSAAQGPHTIGMDWCMAPQVQLCTCRGLLPRPATSCHVLPLPSSPPPTLPLRRTPWWPCSVAWPQLQWCTDAPELGMCLALCCGIAPVCSSTGFQWDPSPKQPRSAPRASRRHPPQAPQHSPLLPAATGTACSWAHRARMPRNKMMVVFMLANATGMDGQCGSAGFISVWGRGGALHTTFVCQNTHCCCVSQLCPRQ